VEVLSNGRATRSQSRVAMLELEDPRWEAFVARHLDALAFHRPAWASLISEAYGFRPFVFAMLNASGSICAGIPVVEVRSPLGRRRWVSLPFTDELPPLHDRGADGLEFAAALDTARREAGIGSLEVRSALAHSGAHRRRDAVLHRLDLRGDPDALFAGFHRSQVQRSIRRAEREGIEVRVGEREDDLTRTFYGLHVATRRRLGVPVQSRRFFKLFWRRLIEPGHGYVLIARARSQPVAAAVFLNGTTSVTYKYGASDRAAWPLRPNHLLFWTAIQRACESGYAELDFGRTDLGDVGLRSFKSGWGTTEEPLEYMTFAERAPGRGKGRAAHLMRGVIRHSPSFVCRATGALFYRYAA
jgi:CelD/BcsL family acetyltransferase involved in cellulose biosynthesis